MQTIKSAETKHQQGFTLIELSIVLVIIGLIVGGVLQGQTIIHAAQIRATLSQLTKLNTEVNTFHDKFNGIPGDLATYANYGFTVPGPAGVNIFGNGLIEDTGGAGVAYNTEIGAFFYEMSTAQMLEVNNMIIANNTAASTPTTLPTLMLAAQMGNTNFIWVSKAGTGTNMNLNTGANYYHLIGVSGISAAGAINGSLKLTPTDAAGIDSKLDDGLPTTGTVQANTNIVGDMVLPAAAANQCAPTIVNGGTYDVAANPTKLECGLVILAGF